MFDEEGRSDASESIFTPAPRVSDSLVDFSGSLRYGMNSDGRPSLMTPSGSPSKVSKLGFQSSTALKKKLSSRDSEITPKDYNRKRESTFSKKFKSTISKLEPNDRTPTSTEGNNGIDFAQMIAPHVDETPCDVPLLEEEFAVFDKDGVIKMSFCQSILDTADTESINKPKIQKTEIEMRHKFMSRLAYHKIWLPQ